MKEGESVSQFSLNFDGTFIWTYNVEESVFAVARSKESSQVILRLDLNNGSTELCAKLPVKIHQRKAVFPTEQFVLYCVKRQLVILPYKGVEMKGQLTFQFSIRFPGLPLSSIAFSAVTMVNNSVFAVLNFGRILYW
jgi:hypothetical protein